jgi:hypothetical protein
MAGPLDGLRATILAARERLDQQLQAIDAYEAAFERLTEAFGDPNTHPDQPLPPSPVPEVGKPPIGVPERTCAECGTSFPLPPGRQGRRLYCSVGAGTGRTAGRGVRGSGSASRRTDLRSRRRSLPGPRRWSRWTSARWWRWAGILRFARVPPRPWPVAPATLMIATGRQYPTTARVGSSRRSGGRQDVPVVCEAGAGAPQEQRPL